MTMLKTLEKQSSSDWHSKERNIKHMNARKVNYFQNCKHYYDEMKSLARFVQTVLSWNEGLELLYFSEEAKLKFPVSKKHCFF